MRKFYLVVVKDEMMNELFEALLRAMNIEFIKKLDNETEYDVWFNNDEEIETLKKLDSLAIIKYGV